MGTRADFYVGRGKDAEWIGSYAYDGHPDSLAEPILAATDEDEFRAAVAVELAGRDDATAPERGWPWPWDDSNTTDYAYALDDGTLFGSSFGGLWFEVDPDAEGFGEPEENDGPRGLDFPNMADRKNVRFDKGSGAMFFSFGG
jgi:hypothetical protein